MIRLESTRARHANPPGNKNFRGTGSICPSRGRKSERMKLTVTLTGQRTLTINLPDWPVIAWANDCSNGGSYLVVRRHRDDGDTLIYAMYGCKAEPNANPV